jgi:hypothetical protein
MDKRLKFSIAVAMPLAAAGLACAWMLATPRDPPLANAPPALVEHCRRAAELLYDISWAAACFKTSDESVDCMLPNDQAAKVNAILAAEEKRCLTAEAQASTQP